MFGFSFTKIVVLLVAIVVVWQAFKYFGQGGQANRVKGKKEAPADPARIDTEECAVCGVYVSGAAGGSGKKDCPYG